MLVGNRALQHLTIKRDVCLSYFFTCHASRHIVIVHRLRVVHPWKPSLYVQRQDVPLRQLIVHVQSEVVNRCLLFRINHLVQRVSRLQNLTIQLTFYLVLLVSSVVVQPDPPSLHVIAHGHIAVREVVEPIVCRDHRRENLLRLPFRCDANDATRTLCVVLRVRTGYDVDALHVGRRNASQHVERCRHTVHQYQHIAVAAYRHLSAAVHRDCRRTAQHFEH